MNKNLAKYTLYGLTPEGFSKLRASRDESVWETLYENTPIKEYRPQQLDVGGGAKILQLGYFFVIFIQFLLRFINLKPIKWKPTRT